MRVAFYGNVCNIFYQIAKAVRAHSDIDAHLFVNSTDHSQFFPESDDPEILDDPPNWIHRGNYQHRGWFAAPWTSSLVPLLESFDLVVCGDMGPMIAQFARKPMALLAMGADLFSYPFPDRFYYLYPFWKDRIGLALKGLWQRRALRRMREIWMQPLNMNLYAVRDLRLDPRRISPLYYPVVIDSRKIAPRGIPANVPSELRFPSDRPRPFLVFHPTRIQIDEYDAKGAQGQGKGNLRLFEGFADFLRQTRPPDARLVLVDRDTCMDGPKAKRWFAQAGIEQNVVWLKPPRSSGFSRAELVDLYSACDVVADQFGDQGQGFGCITLEGCACARPVVTVLDESFLSRLYPWHPLLGASSPSEIAARLSSLFLDSAQREAIGMRSRQWIEQFHSHDAAGPIYAERLESLAARTAAPN